MTDRRKQKPGPSGPGSTVAPLEFLGSPAAPSLSQTKSGHRRLNITPTLLIGLDTIQNVGFRAFPTNEATRPQASPWAMAVAIAHPEMSESFWVGGEMPATLRCVVFQRPGPPCLGRELVLIAVAWVFGLDDQSDSDGVDDAGAGVREPVVKPPPPSAGVMALPVPEVEHEQEAEDTLASASACRNLGMFRSRPGPPRFKDLVDHQSQPRRKIRQSHESRDNGEPTGKKSTDQRESIWRAGIYVRVSTDGQEEESLEAQRAACMRRAEEDGALPVGPADVYEERASGADLDRPALSQLRWAVQAGEVGGVYPLLAGPPFAQLPAPLGALS